MTGVDYLRQRFADALSTRQGSLVAQRDYGANIDDLIDENIDDVFRMRLFGRAAEAIRNPVNGLTDVQLNELELRVPEANTVEVIAYCVWIGSDVSLSATLPVRAA